MSTDLIHADPTVPASVQGADLPWVPSPAPGVARRRIERAGGEVARLTSLVRYDAGSTFPEHMHGGGEEYLVLSGTFSDGAGDQPAGTWVRNGVGSRHAPYTDEGCVILVKLWWMHPDETASTRIDTTDPTGWEPAEGGQTRTLHDGPYDHTTLRRIDAGVTVELEYSGGLELFVVDGALDVDGATLPRWGWVRQPAAGRLGLTASQASLVYVKEGHLRSLPPSPPSPLG